MNYDELVAAATVGVGARPVIPDALPAPADGLAHVLSADPSVAVLDAAALLDAARRAGGFTPRTAELPVAAPDETGPAVPASAVRLLLDVLAHDRLLAAELIGELAGRHVPARFLPALLTAAARDTALREPVAGVLGERGRWLAAQHPEWRRMLAAGSGIASEVDAADESTWATGRPDQRRAWLLARRALDPDAARTLLEAGWTKESGDDRTTLLRALRPQLARADEPLLERALDDRKASVRAVAGQLLGVLPGSDYQQRAVARGGAALRVERHGLRRQLVATPPPEPDAATLRDGVTPRSVDRTLGDGAWRLIQVVASVPLSAWPELLGADPTGLAALRAQQWLREVHVGWRLRAVTEGNAEWARALLQHPLDPPGEPGDVALARLVPAAERVGPLLADVRAGRRDADGDLVPTPWPAELTEAVLGYVGKQLNAAAHGPPPAIISSLGRHAAVDVASDAAPADALPTTLRELADRARARTEQHYQAQSWGQALDAAAESLDLRRRIRRALESA